MTAGVYLHIPFCKSKCPYCDFYSVESDSSDTGFRSSFVDAISSEIMRFHIERVEVPTVYFGGGTPSILQGQQYAHILKRIGETFQVSPDAEITLEVNPGEVNRERLEAFEEAGINRLSVGAQSLNAKELRTLGRTHDTDDVYNFVRTARECGYMNIGLDIIYGVPGQTIRSISDTTENIISLAPEHVSVYSLTYEVNTPFHEWLNDGIITKIKESEEIAMGNIITEMLKSAGYDRYEISNYAMKGNISKHNSSYWKGTPYFGFGPSAHSYDGNKRWWNVRDVEAYVTGIQAGKSMIGGSETLTKHQKMLERIMLGLRTSEGVDIQTFSRDFGVALTDTYKDSLERASNLTSQSGDALIFIDDSKLKLTEIGFRYCDEIVELFTP